MTTPAKKPYHKNRHPWKNQDLRSDVKRAAGPRPGTATKVPVRVVPHTCADPVCEATLEVEPIPLCIEIVESATGKVEKKLGPYATERLRDKADDGLTRQLDHEHFYTRYAP